ncbi:MAG: GNAT family N-acetyltransferase [Pirellulales bacterium]
MTVRNLERIFRPQRIAVIGASDRQGTVGYTLFKNLAGSGFHGEVYPVNEKRNLVQGAAAFPKIAAVPLPVDLAVICTPAATAPELVRQCGEAGVLGLVIISAGFRETGPEGRALEAEVLQQAAQFPGMRIIGPNCLGVIVPHLKLNASFASAMPPAGRMAFLSQSGALCTAILDWALEEGVGFSCFVSMGNMLDVGFGDLIDYLAADPLTDSMLLYVESISAARTFMSAARSFARQKPIIAYKAGRFPQSAQAAASHTGALAGVDAVYDAAFARAGIVRVFEMGDMFACAELLARHKTPAGPRLAIVTNAGGPGVMASDALLARGGTLASLTPQTIENLNATLPAFWSHANPIDVLGDATPERFAAGVAAALADPQVDAALAILTPQAMTDPTGTADAVARVAAGERKLLLAAWMGAASVRAGSKLLAQAGVPTYTTPAAAVQAFHHLVAYARNRETLYETPADLGVAFGRERDQVRQRLEAATAQGERLLSEVSSKEIVATYGIPVTRPLTADSAEAAVAAATELGYPVVLKIVSPQITHKTDVGGVRLNLNTAAEVRTAFEQMTARVREQQPSAELQGVSVQRMVAAADGREILVGASKDPVFGPVVMVGMGGVAAEVIADRALGLPPLNERLARRMLESLRAWPLLAGHRGRPAVAIDKLIEVLIRTSQLVADQPLIKELDVNPLLATPHDVVGLDVRIVLDEPSPTRTGRPYEHLAITPYPEQLVRAAECGGQPITLRPIRPEDEPLWRRLLAETSAESRWRRFGYSFAEVTHELAARFCFVDYDRELAIVAETGEGADRKLLGVGRLTCEPDRRIAHLALLVIDSWQGRGLGSLLADYCLELADRGDIEEVLAETEPENGRMLSILRRRRFRFESGEGQVVGRRLRAERPA